MRFEFDEKSEINLVNDILESLRTVPKLNLHFNGQFSLITINKNSIIILRK